MFIIESVDSITDKDFVEKLDACKKNITSRWNEYSSIINANTKEKVINQLRFIFGGFFEYTPLNPNRVDEYSTYSYVDYNDTKIMIRLANHGYNKDSMRKFISSNCTDRIFSIQFEGNSDRKVNKVKNGVQKPTKIRPLPNSSLGNSKVAIDVTRLSINHLNNLNDIIAIIDSIQSLVINNNPIYEIPIFSGHAANTKNKTEGIMLSEFDLRKIIVETINRILK
jgi:hypothetical protein